MVINSHMAICYPNCPTLATGGGIGNALFFFISGFTLFLSPMKSFMEFFKGRIIRIFPSLIAISFCASLLWNSELNFTNQLFAYWFVNCIMVYYAILWVCRWLKLSMTWVIVGALILTSAIFLAFYDFNSVGLIYGSADFRYYIYFVYMAQGALIGMHRQTYTYKPIWLVLLVISLVGWYGINAIFKESVLQLLSIPCLLLLTFSLYLCCKSPLMCKMMSKKKPHLVIAFCGSLCLESYLIQSYIITDAYNALFPLNVPLIMCMCIATGWLLSVFSRWIQQTFASAPYDWRKMLTFNWKI